MRDQVFISYSHQDARWLDRLQVYLAPIERRGAIRRWDDSLIRPGQRWEREIAEALDRTRVAVLLVSADFLASDFIHRVELPRLLGAAEDEGMLIIPVVLECCNFERCAELAQFQSINSPAHPLDTLPEPEQKAVLAKLAAAVEDSLSADAGTATAAQPGRLVGLPARNPLFTGRDEVLAAIVRALGQSGRAALCGLPGLGKTETAIEFAHRNRSSYAWVFWSRADSEQQILRGFCAIAAALGLPEARGADQPAAAAAASAALSACGNCLLILDSADDLDLLRPWLPAGEQAQVLLTTRGAAVGGLADPIELEPLGEDAAAAFLLRRARLTDGDAASQTALLVAARQVARDTAGVPLALDQAGAYLEETGCSVEEYCTLWRDHSFSLLGARGQGSLRQGESLIQAWSLSLSQLERVQPAAVALLRLFAFYHCDALPHTALGPGATLAGSELSGMLANPIGRNALLRDVLRFGFLRRDAKTQRLHMHRLMQQFLRDGETREAQVESCARALCVLDAAFPNARFVSWRDCDALAAHAVSVLDHAAALDIESAAEARLAGELGYYFIQRARYAEAEPRVARAVALRRRAVSCDPAELARALMIDGQLQVRRSRLDAAAERLNEAAALLGQAPPGVELVRVLDMLASVELVRDGADAAEARLAQALAVADSAGARRSAEAAQCANSLGAARFRRGDYQGARAAFEEAAALRRELLPPEHPSIAQSLNNLAAVCARLGERAAARASYGQALSLREAALGANHPDVAESLLNLALLDLKDGELSAARTALERAIAIQQACRGPLNLPLAKAQACLGDVALAEGRLDEAQQLYAQAREACVKLLGADHPDSARALVGLSDVVRARGQDQAAAALLRDALPVLRRHLGESHPDAVECEQDLARLMRTEKPSTEVCPGPAASARRTAA